MNIEFSVVIPLYNKEDSIFSTIQSVLGQSYGAFEMVVVDDGSTDNSAEVVKNISDRRIRLISKRNGGVSSARNEGIRQASHEYIAFLDADDVWDRTYLEEMAELVNDYQSCGIWGTNYRYLVDGELKEKKVDVASDFRGLLLDVWSDGIPFLFCSSAVCCRKTMLQEIGGFDERICYGEDIDVWWRLMLRYPAAYCNKCLATYRFDFEGRLMSKHIPLEKLYIYYYEKYSAYRGTDNAFRHFIDQECMWWLYPYFVENSSDADVLRILDQIDLTEYKWSFKFRFKYPRLYQFCKRFL